MDIRKLKRLHTVTSKVLVTFHSHLLSGSEVTEVSACWLSTWVQTTVSYVLREYNSPECAQTDPCIR